MVSTAKFIERSDDGLTIAEAWDVYSRHSRKASDVFRQLALAGVAIIWIFTQTDAGPQLPRDMIVPAVVILPTLAADLVQYWTLADRWGRAAREAELAGLGRDDRFKVRTITNRLGQAMWLFKLRGITVAYAALIVSLVARLF